MEYFSYKSRHHHNAGQRLYLGMPPLKIKAVVQVLLDNLIVWTIGSGLTRWHPPDYHHACDFEGILNNPPIYAYAHGYPDGMGRVNIGYCHLANNSEMIQTCTENPLLIGEEYTFSAYLGINRATTQGALMPTKLALYGSIGNCGVTTSFPGAMCPPSPAWELLTEIPYTYDGDQGWIYGQSDCFIPSQPYNRFVIGTSCDIMLCGGCVLDLVELHLCQDFLAVDMEITPNTCAQHALGAINLIVRGDNPPFTYDWAFNGVGDTDDPEDLTELVGGSYPVTVTDAAGLTRCLDIFVPEDIEAPIPTYFLPIPPLCQGATPPVLKDESHTTPEVTGTWVPAVINTTNPGISDYTFYPGPEFCADTFILSVTVLSASLNEINYEGCLNDGYSILVNSVIYDESNPVGTEIISNADGCDSIVEIDLSFNSEINHTENHIGCIGDGYSITVNDVLYDEGNPNGTEVLTSAKGCDSIVTIDLFYTTRRDSQIIYRGCVGDGYELIINDVKYNEDHPSGVEVITRADCDISLVIDFFFDPIINFEKFVEFSQTASVELNITSEVAQINSAIVSIRWDSPINLTCADCLSPTFNGSAPEDFTVTIVDERGCVHQGIVHLFINETENQLFIPNSFSPNNDGINDQFQFFSAPNSTVNIGSLQIFDRWGSRIFERYNLALSHPSLAWNGQVNGKASAQGVYVYVIKWTDSGLNEFVRYGHITLVR